MGLTAAVAEAVEELRASFPDAVLSTTEDGSGGAQVRLDGLDPGAPFCQRHVWVGFHVTFQYPLADVYPHYVQGDLARVDGAPLLPPFHVNHPSPWGLAVMISRRSNRRDPATATAATKLVGVLEWMAGQ